MVLALSGTMMIITVFHLFLISNIVNEHHVLGADDDHGPHDDQEYSRRSGVRPPG
jgi:hypothetical protein